MSDLRGAALALETRPIDPAKRFEETDKLWVILEIALEDFARCEADPRVEIDMGNWFLTDHEQGTCEVCFAGAVMRGCLKRAPTSKRPSVIPEDFNRNVCNKLYALDDLRVGNLRRAYGFLHGHGKSCALIDRRIATYAVDPITWGSQMGKLLADLKSLDV